MFHKFHLATASLGCGILPKTQGWRPQNGHRVFIKVDTGPSASAIVPSPPINFNDSGKGRDQMLPKFLKHTFSRPFEVASPWPPSYHPGRGQPGRMGDTESPDQLWDVMSRLRLWYIYLAECSLAPCHILIKNGKRVIGFKCQDVPSVGWKAHIYFLSYTVFLVLW